MSEERPKKKPKPMKTLQGVFIVGVVTKVIGPKVIAWDCVAVRMTRKGADDACTTEQHFYFEGWFGDKHRNSPVVHPRRPKE